MILVIGVELLKESFAKVLHPTEVAFSWLMVAVLIASILVKLWMSRLNRQIGTAIDSETLLATAACPARVTRRQRFGSTFDKAHRLCPH